VITRGRTDYSAAGVTYLQFITVLNAVLLFFHVAGSDFTIFISTHSSTLSQKGTRCSKFLVSHIVARHLNCLPAYSWSIFLRWFPVRTKAARLLNLAYSASWTTGFTFHIPAYCALFWPASYSNLMDEYRWRAFLQPLFIHDMEWKHCHCRSFKLI